MKKITFILLALLVLFSSCEKDDICVEETTPRLKIKFYNFENQEELKKANIDSIYLETYEVMQSTLNVSVDSVYVPLNLTVNTTNLIIAANSVSDTLSFTYSRNDEFVSRSCGFKTIFENVVLTNHTKNWIKLAILNTQTIENEEQTHISIYH
ncbi:MAG TPA: DUF6452 family protein [Flavobacteriaceae bacterium]|nr:DUF6452 family protein [Flavobacteriaceae bacterium]